MKPPPRKKWGQNFLRDPNLIRKIIRTIEPHSDDSFLEIGPGTGSLTEYLCPEVAHLAAVEIDPLLVKILTTEKQLAAVHFIQGDVLRLKLEDLPIPRPVRVVGNIPYNISSPIIFWLIKQRKDWQDTFLMIQKEMAERLVAKVGTKEYGRLTVMTRAFFEVELCFTIPPHVFTPRPRVESAFVSVKKKTVPLVQEEQFTIFEKLVGAAFAQRRKMLKNTLAGFSVLTAHPPKVDLRRRPEQLTVEEFVSLLEQMRN